MVWASVFFGLSWLAMVLSGLAVKRDDKSQSIITWGSVIIVLSGCWHALVAGVFSAVHIQVNIVTMGICDLLIALFLGLRIKKEKQMQKYRVDMGDILFLVFTLLLVLGLIKNHYAGSLLLPNYVSIDPSVHIKSAMDVINAQKVQGMYYSALNNGLLMEMLLPVYGVGYSYKSFVIAELFNLAMAGLSFYGLTKLMVKDTYTKYAMVVLSILYLLGYPLLNSLYGFMYLGVGVTICAVLIILVQEYLRDEKNERYYIVGMCLGCVGVVQCYVLFAPVTYFAIITCIFVKAYREGRLVSLDTAKKGLEVFLIPCVIGIYYSYLGVYGSPQTVASQINIEGAAYRDLFSNFIMLVPFALWAVCRLVKNKENSMLLSYGLYGIFFTAGMLLLAVAGRVSAYYYYKLYYLLWLIFFSLFAYALSRFNSSEKNLLHAFAVVALILGGMLFGRVEQRIANKNPLLCDTPKVEKFLDVYSFNLSKYKENLVCTERLELYQKLVDDYLQDGEKKAVISGYWEDEYWFEAVTNLRLQQWNYVCSDKKEFDGQMKENHPDYIVVTYNQNDFYNNNTQFFDKFNVLYENQEGFIAEVK